MPFPPAATHVDVLNEVAAEARPIEYGMIAPGVTAKAFTLA
jgi:hypothetical protein